MTESNSDARTVFVVHGRNAKARRAMFAFLRSINLKPLEWSSVVKATGKPSPYIGDILAQGFAMAHAAVVLMTPDDEARLKKEFWEESDGENEKEFAGQPRQNVLFEAGMSMGLHDDRSVVVELGKVRPMSDTLGRYVVRMDGSVKARQELAERLKTAGCDVILDGTDWQSEGDFQAAVAVEVAPETRKKTEQTSPSTPETPSEDQREPAKTPTAADFVNLGEHLWFLANPPSVAVDTIVKVIRNFLAKVDSCKLPKTRVAASPLANLSFSYDIITNQITPQSLRDLTTIMIPIRSTLESEARDL